MRVEFGEGADRLSWAFPKLSRQLKKCASYILEHPSEVATFSMRQLAARAGVPPSTMNRLAKALDFDTYDEFRALYRDSINDQSTGYSLQDGQVHAIARESEFDHVLNGFQQAALGNINTLFDHIDREALERAVQALADARAVLVVGLLASESSANYLHHLAARGFRNWQLLAGDSAELAQQLESLAPGDVVVCISVEPCAADSIRVARHAREAGARVIGITDRRTSPLAACSDDILLISIQSPSVFPSQVGAITLIEVLVGMIAARDDRSVTERVKKLERSLRSLGKYWSE
ncbi:MAG: MurR/RpiR family transcriptional regulator [Rhodospirillales bacterium]|nr:MurR/RpiR family transcriptional regulator [Rhodospirillales bacterium]